MVRLKRLALAWVLVCLGGLSAAAAAAEPPAGGLRAGDLRCEYRRDPRGIDVAQPRLSWMLLSDRRGDRQAAYQVLVASTADALARDGGDVWDSGKVASDET